MFSSYRQTKSFWQRVLLTCHNMREFEWNQIVLKCVKMNEFKDKENLYIYQTNLCVLCALTLTLFCRVMVLNVKERKNERKTKGKSWLGVSVGTD